MAGLRSDAALLTNQVRQADARLITQTINQREVCVWRIATGGVRVQHRRHVLLYRDRHDHRVARRLVADPARNAELIMFGSILPM